MATTHQEGGRKSARGRRGEERDITMVGGGVCGKNVPGQWVACGTDKTPEQALSPLCVSVCVCSVTSIFFARFSFGILSLQRCQTSQQRSELWLCIRVSLLSVSCSPTRTLSIISFIAKMKINFDALSPPFLFSLSLSHFFSGILP